MIRHGAVILAGVGIALVAMVLLAVAIVLVQFDGGAVEISGTMRFVVWFVSALAGSAFASRRAQAGGIGPAVGVSGVLILTFLIVSRLVLDDAPTVSTPPSVIAMAMGGAAGYFLTLRRGTVNSSSPAV